MRGDSDVTGVCDTGARIRVEGESLDKLEKMAMEEKKKFGWEMARFTRLSYRAWKFFGWGPPCLHHEGQKLF